MYVPEREIKKEKNMEQKPIHKEVSAKLTAGQQEKVMAVIYNDPVLTAKLENLPLSQLNRFYTLIKSRRYALDSAEIKKFIQKQIERNQGKDFYAYFEGKMESIAKNEKELNRAMIQAILRYTRYLIGRKKVQKQIEEETKTVENKKEA